MEALINLMKLPLVRSVGAQFYPLRRIIVPDSPLPLLLSIQYFTFNILSGIKYFNRGYNYSAPN
jgi:hypothetical protein